MVALSGPAEELRRRKSRNVLVAAVTLLAIIWTIKLVVPSHTAMAVYSTSASKISSALTPAPKKVYKPKTTLNTLPNIVAEESNFAPIKNNKAAVIVETRFRTNLVPLILHFSSVLGPDWPILIYTSRESVGLFSASAALSRHIAKGAIQIRILPQTVLFTNSDSVNSFMTKTWLWESLEPAEHILIFQSDSMLCANAARSVDDFFEYDLIGAPITPKLGKGYNGGLSLRKRSTTLRVLSTYNDHAKIMEDRENVLRFEDRWYFDKMSILAKNESRAGIDPDEVGAIKLPSMEVARTFAVETIDYPHPLGVHQVGRWMKKNEHLDEWCPEYKLCSTEHVVDKP